MGHIQAGKLKGLAVAGKARHPGIPNVPTTAEAGLKGFELEAWVGIFAPAGTPPDVIAKLSGSIKQAMEQAETKTRANAAGIEIRYLPPDALDAAGQARDRVLGQDHQRRRHHGRLSLSPRLSSQGGDILKAQTVTSGHAISRHKLPDLWQIHPYELPPPYPSGRLTDKEKSHATVP